MIKFRTLGTVELHESGGDDVHDVLVQPRRIALLACLALQGRRFNRRDTLLPMFWPESDQEHARGALRNALYHLRRALGADVLVTRGDEEIGLDWDVFWCDAVAFDEAIDEERCDTALELYGGDLLAGFHVSDAALFERWLDGERQRLRDRAAEAAWRCAEVAERTGDAQAATQCAERAFNLAGDDEASLRRLVNLLDRVGERPRAIRAFEEFSRHLAAEYGIEPGPETLALVEEVRRPRWRAPATRQRPPEPRQDAEPGVDRGVAESDVATSLVLTTMAPPAAARAVFAASVPNATSTATDASPERSPASAADKPASRRARSRLLLSTAAAALIAAVAFMSFRLRQPASVPLSSSTVAVLPFGFHGSDDYRYLADGMVELLSTKLNGAGDLHGVDPHSLLHFYARESTSPAGPDQGRRVAQRFGAGLFVLGSVVTVGDQLSLSAQLYEVQRRRPLAEASAQGPVDHIFDLVDALAEQLLAGQSNQPATRLTRLAAMTTHSFPALKAFLEGEKAFRDGDAAAAVEALQRATTLDSTFAIAYYRLSLAAEWSNRTDLVRSAMDQAVRYSQRLSGESRALLEAADAWRRGDGDEAQRRYTAILASDPSNVEAWFQLGEILYHYGPVRGLPATDARQPFERALNLDPDLIEARGHLAFIAATQGRWAEFDTLAAWIEAKNPGSNLTAELHAIRAFGSRDSAAESRVLRILAERGEQLVRFTASAVFQTTFDVDAWTRVTRLLVEPWQPGETRGLGHIWLARLAVARGDWAVADSELAAAARLERPRALEARAFLATLPFVTMAPVKLAEIRDSVSEWNATAVPASPMRAPAYAVDDGSHPAIRLYLLGLLSARLGEDSLALRYANRLIEDRAAAEAGTADARRRRVFSHGIRAEVARLEGRYDDALRELDAEPAPSWYQTMVASPFASQTRERFVRAEALRGLGRDAEALRWYATFATGPSYLLPFLPATLLRRAQAEERLGRRADAAADYGRALRYWDHASGSFAALAAEARRGLARLGEAPANPTPQGAQPH
jgi:DNA-binding SARP family transcriptional activator/tetratricopeptide (TPR) repeat protein